MEEAPVPSVAYHFYYEKDEGSISTLAVERLHKSFGDKTHEFAAVIGLWKTFTLHEAALVENIRGVEEAIGGDQIHFRVGIPTLEQQLEYTGAASCSVKVFQRPMTAANSCVLSPT